MTRRETPLRAADILVALADHDVDLIVIGGLAVQAHGHVRTTQDVDVFPSPDRSNLERLSLALRSLGARLEGDDEPINAERIADASTLTLDSRAGGIDIHLSPPGAGAYEAVRARALEIEVAGVRVAVAGKDDLIAMKRAAGRPLDRGDIVAITADELQGEDAGGPA